MDPLSPNTNSNSNPRAPRGKIKKSSISDGVNLEDETSNFKENTKTYILYARVIFYFLAKVIKTAAFATTVHFKIFLRIVTGCCSQQDLSLRQSHRFRMNPTPSPFDECAWKDRNLLMLVEYYVIVCRGALELYYIIVGLHIILAIEYLEHIT